MSVQLIQQYHAQVQKIIRYGGSRNEGSVRKAFHDLLEGYSRPRSLEMVAELEIRNANGRIEIDTLTTLSGIPAEAWEYKLGNCPALEWVLDRYKERKPKDPTIREQFNTYRFKDYKEQVIDLVMRVCTVSVETQRIINQMPDSQEDK